MKEVRLTNKVSLERADPVQATPHPFSSSWNTSVHLSTSVIGHLLLCYYQNYLIFFCFFFCKCKLPINQAPSKRKRRKISLLYQSCYCLHGYFLVLWLLLRKMVSPFLIPPTKLVFFSNHGNYKPTARGHRMNLICWKKGHLGSHPV